MMDVCHVTGCACRATSAISRLVIDRNLGPRVPAQGRRYGNH